MSRLLALLFVLGLIVPLSGCPGDDDDDVTIPDDDDDVTGDDDDATGDDDDATGDDDDATGDDDDATGDDDDATPIADAKVVGYFTEWGIYDRDFQVEDIPAELLTHLNYAFVDLGSDGLCHFFDEWAALSADGGNFPNLQTLKAAHPDLEILLSVGGWTLSTHFSDVALTPASRAAMAASCIQFVTDYGFDGLDIDWEYPVSGGLGSNTTRPEDKENYTLLLQEIRDQMDLIDPDLRLTIAAPAGPSTIPNMDLPDLAGPLDWINLMAYDLNGSWSPTTGHNAALFAPTGATGDAAILTVDNAVQTYLAAGVPPEKLVLGVPFYGRGFAAVGADGIGQAFTGMPAGTWEPGNLEFGDLDANYVGTSDWVRTWDDGAKVPSLYSASEQVWISYDDTESFGHKIDYIVDQGLGGAMFWELSNDTDTFTLTQQLAGTLIVPE